MTDPLIPGAARDGRRFATPPLLQMEATECGAASLGIILAHYGRWVPLEELRVACGVSRDGSKASGVLRAARAYGLHAKGYKRDLADVSDLRLPLVVFWNFNHFLVVEGIDRRRGTVFLNDPAQGHRTVSMAEFDDAFTGVCLAFAPGPEFQPGGAGPAIGRNVKKRIRGLGGPLTYVGLVALAATVPAMVVPVFTGIFVDHVLLRQSTDWLMPLLIGMGVTALGRGLIAWLLQVHLARIEIDLSLTTSRAFLWHVLRLPIEFFFQRRAGDLTVRVNGNDRVASLIAQQLAPTLIGLVSMAILGLAMLSYDWLMTVALVALTASSGLALLAASRSRETVGRTLLKHEGQMQASVMAGVQMIDTLKSSGLENEFFSRLGGVLANYLNTVQAMMRQTELLNAVPRVTTGLATALVLAIGGWRVMEGVLTIGGVVAFQSLAGSFLQPLAGLVRLGGDLQTAKGDLARLEDVQAYALDPRAADEASLLDAPPDQGGLSGAILFRDVVFGYARHGAPLLDGFSLTVRPGERVALVGASGSGKSTLGRLACGLYQPWSGDILFDDKPLSRIPPRLFHRSVAMVDQDISLFEGSLRDNLSLWNPALGEDRILRALRDAEMLDDIQSRPRRWECHVAENGANFSGGQRQRLEIARALAGDPSILVLDEATSALDPQVEAAIDLNLRRRGCTCLIIAHRLSTIRDCDQIIVLDKGRIVERGTHEELVASRGAYLRLIESEAAP
ncbi:MAG: NHLP family bacteriocin export ABC transporter peptidase/permease/ATPase subunit [Alphaproteobacteria bacterium]|nr:NHLP family bacteriocin export ABC transporter peptidase/permease/ATPase subunit [Alphaproteobacteria bacterium]